MNFPPPRKARREIVVLQLTAMIDIFAILIIFLIKGTVFGASEIVIPSSLHIPRSVSKETVETAPRAVITDKDVTFSILAEVFPLQEFEPGHETQAKAIQSKLQQALDQLGPEAKKGGGPLLSVLADENAPYRNVFNVVRIARGAGFQTVSMIAAGAGEGGP